MKTYFLLPVCTIVFTLVPMKEQPAKTYFYFCVSKPMDKDPQEKQTILYSDIHQIEIESIDFAAAKVRQWQTWVSARCASKAGCTSDLNYYATRAKAKTAYTETLQSFSDTSKFVLKKVKFQ